MLRVSWFAFHCEDRCLQPLPSFLYGPLSCCLARLTLCPSGTSQSHTRTVQAVTVVSVQAQEEPW